MNDWLIEWLNDWIIEWRIVECARLYENLQDFIISLHHPITPLLYYSITPFSPFSSTFSFILPGYRNIFHRYCFLLTNILYFNCCYFSAGNSGLILTIFLGKYDRTRKYCWGKLTPSHNFDLSTLLHSCIPSSFRLFRTAHFHISSLRFYRGAIAPNILLKT